MKKYRNLLLGILFGGIFFWWAAPIIGGLIGTYILGLHGAAAISAGLAWLGLGSLAAGGFGMFGGAVIVTSTGAILAGSTSHLALRFLADNMSKENAIMDCSKSIQLFEAMLVEYKQKKISEGEILAFNQKFAATIFGLQLNQGERDENFNEKAFEEGMQIYRKALGIIEEKRKKHKIYFEREK